MTKRGDLTESARAAEARQFSGTIFENLVVTPKVPVETDAEWLKRREVPPVEVPAPHDWALAAIRRDIRYTAEAMSVFSSEDVRERMSPELLACLDVAPNMMGQAFKEAAKLNEIRLRDDLPSVVSMRGDAKGRRLSQWSKT